MHLVLARHGHYGDVDLSADGRRQYELLAEHLRSLVSGKRVSVVASHAPRALQSAAILAEKLALPEAEVHNFLLSGGDHLPDSKATEAIKLIQSKQNDCDVLIVVAHYEYLKYFPNVFYKQSGKELGAYIGEPQYAEALVIDCESWEITKLRPVPVIT